MPKMSSKTEVVANVDRVISSSCSQEEQEYDCRVELPLAIRRDIERQKKLEKLKKE